MENGRKQTFFFFNDTATTEIYTLSLHDALPISARTAQTALETYYTDEQTYATADVTKLRAIEPALGSGVAAEIGKSTRLNSSHANISYAVFCLKKQIFYDPLLTS